MNPLVRWLLLGLLALGTLAAAGDQAPTPRPTASPGPQLEEFVPSERVPADRAVSFPVDI
jgi:hypothetical protein